MLKPGRLLWPGPIRHGAQLQLGGVEFRRQVDPRDAAGDTALVNAVPEIDLVLGGHEHENWALQRGPHFTPIIKADANVRSLAIVQLSFGAAGMRPSVRSRIDVVNDTVKADPAVDQLAKQWTKTAFDAFRADGFAAMTDADYDVLRVTARVLNLDLARLQ